MIIGIGTDIIEVDRIKKAVEKEYFLNKVYTKREVEAFGENYAGIERMRSLYGVPDPRDSNADTSDPWTALRGH